VHLAATPTVVEKPAVQTVIVEKPVVQTVIVEKEKVVEKPVVQTVIVEKVVTATPSEKEQILTISLDGESVTVDPHVAASRAFTLLDRNIYEPLVGLKRDTYELEPVLAESWDVSPDQLTYTFHLRKDVKFHDGTPFNAEAAKVSLERQLATKKGSYWVLSYLKEITVVDEYTVKVVIEAGGPPFLKGLTMVFMVSPTAVKEHEKDGDLAQNWLSSNVAGTGPYILTDWARGDRMVLEQFPDYWQGWDGQHFARVILLVIPEAGTQQLMLEQGEVDIAEKTPLEAIENLSKNPDISIYQSSGVRVLYLRFNCAAGPTADAKVRQALAYAFDYEGFRQATGGFFQPSDGPVPAQFMGGWKPEIPYFNNDLEKSKQLFEEAGIQPGTVFDCYWVSGTPEQQLAAQILQAGLVEIGFNLNIIEQEWAPLSKGLVEWGATKDPATAKPMFFLWTPPRIPDAYAYLWYMYHTEASGGRGRNLMYYSNPEVDELINKGALAIDEQEKLEYYKQAVEIIVGDSPDIFIGPKDRVYAVRSSVKGFYIHPTWYPAWHLYPMYRGE